MSCKYRMLAIDLDGTLLSRDHTISRGNLDAITKAMDAGLLVVPCTGRAYREATLVLRCWPNMQPGQLGVFVTGAVVGDCSSGESLDLAMLEPHLALEIAGAIEDEPDAVLVFQEASAVGHDYLVTGKGTLSNNTQWWFATNDVKTHFKRDLTLEDMHHTLRVGLVTTRARMEPVVAKLQARFGGRVLIQSFQAVGDADPNAAAHEMIEVLEVFAAGVDKWRGLQWIAEQKGIAQHEIAAIGDEINDIVMLEKAGCGVAMENAVPGTLAVADHVTKDRDADGVGYAIEQILAGRW